MIFLTAGVRGANCRASKATHDGHLGAVCDAHVRAHESQKSTAASAQPANCLVPHCFWTRLFTCLNIIICVQC